MAEDQLQRSKADAQPSGTRTGEQPFTVHGLLPSWDRSLRAKRRSERTRADYLKDTTRFLDWLATEGHPTDDPNLITRRHIEAYIASELDRVSERTGKKIAPGSAASSYRRIQQFFAWLKAEGEITTDPFTELSPPALEEKPVPVIPVDDLRALLATCEGSSFGDRRDAAILRVFVDTGCRLGEIAGITVDDIDWRADAIRVYGKGPGGNRPRDVPLGAKTVQALDRYVRVRARHRFAGSQWLWLGTRGKNLAQMTESGIYRMICRRAGEAGIGHIHPHQFRHTQAHRWKANGGQDDDLMQLMGWKSRDMISRYGASAAAERARDAHRRMALGEEL